jgi:hypothetical protein
MRFDLTDAEWRVIEPLLCSSWNLVGQLASGDRPAPPVGL